MRPESFAAGVLAVYLLTCPVIAETNLPRLQPAEPVFAKHAIKSRPSICNGVAGNGATIEHTVQTTFIDPLIVIAEDLARLFRPFFSDEATTEEAKKQLEDSSESAKEEVKATTDKLKGIFGK